MCTCTCTCMHIYTFTNTCTCTRAVHIHIHVYCTCTNVHVYRSTTALCTFYVGTCTRTCRYDERIDRVETRIAARLRDQLGTAKSANEMFRIFSRYNALFVRSHIRGAIREYQTQLIQRVKDDIESLHNKFKVSALAGAGERVCFLFIFLFNF